jgi:fructokinase
LCKPWVNKSIGFIYGKPYRVKCYFCFQIYLMIACYGEALVDLIVSPYSHSKLQTTAQACLGGSVFNFCIAAQRQGMQALYLNALSQDSFGQQFAQVLKQEGVAIDVTTPCPEPTSIAVVQLDAQGKASYSFLREGVADTARDAQNITANWRSEIRQLHTGCLMLMPDQWPKTRAVLAHALESGCLVSVDANVRLAVCPQLLDYRESVLQACAMAHWVKVSDDDLVALGLLDTAHSAEQAIQVGKTLLDRCASHTQGIAITLGAQGACLVHRAGHITQAAPTDIHIKDTVGAGDAFMAALLAYFDHQDALYPAAIEKQKHFYSQALAHAIAAASYSVQRVGSDPALWRELVA